MNRQAKRIAMADGVDLRLVSRLADKRVVWRDRAVIAETQNLADVRRRILRLLTVIAIAAGHVEEPGAVEREARAVAAARRTLPAAARRQRRGAVRRVGDQE